MEKECACAAAGTYSPVLLQQHWGDISSVYTVLARLMHIEGSCVMHTWGVSICVYMCPHVHVCMNDKAGRELMTLCVRVHGGGMERAQRLRSGRGTQLTVSTCVYI